ncbi:MAG: class I SAM-dependent methyltransferase [Acidobacteriota bacterium]|nr:class I SAM-dependent methyltransferase [Blastocatellia bacterium]MDW8238673.1 class I SAM-dependent methyltransferase [Acidobacteriota bacterium]
MSRIIAVMVEPTSLTEKSYWDRKWDARAPARRLNLREYLNSRIAAMLADVLPPTPARVLEVGAADSLWLPYLGSTYGYEVVGVDYSRVGCQRLVANLAEMPGEAMVVEGDVTQPCFAPGSFDVVFSNGFIEHFTEYGQLVALFRSWLKPRGLLITLVPNKHYAFRYVEQWIAPTQYHAHVLIEPSDLQKAYEQAGLQEIVAGYLGSFATWKYNSKAKGLTRWLLRVSAKAIGWPVHTVLRTTGWTPESRMFSPLVYAVGRAPQ